MKRFEIYLSDLTDEARKNFLAFIDADDDETFANAPLAVFETSPEDENGACNACDGSGCCCCE